MRRYLSGAIHREYVAHLSNPIFTSRPLSVTPIHRVTDITPADAFAYLGLPVNSSPEQCRDAYIKLARQLHPDSKAPANSSPEISSNPIQSDHSSFQHLQEAYQVALKAAQNANPLPASSSEPMESSEPCIRHRAPQHRRFLEAESRLGSNSGASLAGLSPAERYRQLQTQRFAEAAYSAADYRVARVCAAIESERSLSVRTNENGRRRTKLKSTNFIERLADELIEEAIDRGEFDQLAGQGKPLSRESHADAFADPATTKITRILVDQGYLPEWVQLSKEVRERWDKAVAKLDRNSNASVLPNATLNEFREEVRKINRLIDRYNLLVPALHLQRVHKNADQFLDEMRMTRIKNGKRRSPSPLNPISQPPTTTSESPSPGAKDNSAGQAENKPEKQSKDNGSDSENLWNPRYLAQIMVDFYRELARAYVSMMRGFKDHR